MDNIFSNIGNLVGSMHLASLIVLGIAVSIIIGSFILKKVYGDNGEEIDKAAALAKQKELEEKEKEAALAKQKELEQQKGKEELKPKVMNSEPLLNLNNLNHETKKDKILLR